MIWILWTQIATLRNHENLRKLRQLAACKVNAQNHAVVHRTRRVLVGTEAKVNMPFIMRTGQQERWALHVDAAGVVDSRFSVVKDTAGVGVRLRIGLHFFRLRKADVHFIEHFTRGPAQGYDSVYEMGRGDV